MSIKQGDIQLLASRVMDDVPEGGGGPSSIVIESGQENAIVPDISEMDRATGRANMRQLCVTVRTDDRDTYQGSNVIVAKPPEDPNVSITLFATGEVYGTRAQAQARLEAYLNKGAEWPGYLYENHIKGQRVIQIFQRPGTELAAVGKTLVLVGNEGQSNEYEQYVRVIRATSIERTFTYDIDKDFRAMVVTLEISDALRYDFAGSSAGRAFTRLANAARIRDTLVADAGSYVGVSALQKAAALGDFTVIAKTIMTQIVPSAQSETPIPAAIPYAAAGLPVSAAEVVTFNTDQAWSTATSLVLPGGCLPGSLKIVVGGITFTDVGGSSIVIQWCVPTQETVQPAADIRVAQVIALDIPSERGLNAGYFDVGWLINDQQYRATGLPNGQLTGDASGSIDITRNELTIAPNVLPPVGTELTVTYDTGDWAERRFEHPARNGQAKLKLNVGVGGLVPGAVHIEWNTVTDVSVLGSFTLEEIRKMGVALVDPTHQARDNAEGKLLLGNLEIGTVNYAAGEIEFNPDVVVSLPRPQYEARRGGWANWSAGTWRVNYSGIEYVPAPRRGSQRRARRAGA